MIGYRIGMMYRPSSRSMSEWQMPTERAATSTSSSPISGTGSSATLGRPCCVNCSAFIAMSFPVARSAARVDEHLHLIAGRRQERLEALRDDIRQRDLRGHDLLDGELA